MFLKFLSRKNMAKKKQNMAEIPTFLVYLHELFGWIFTARNELSMKLALSLYMGRKISEKYPPSLSLISWKINYSLAFNWTSSMLRLCMIKYLLDFVIFCVAKGFLAAIQQRIERKKISIRWISAFCRVDQRKCSGAYFTVYFAVCNFVVLSVVKGRETVTKREQTKTFFCADKSRSLEIKVAIIYKKFADCDNR